MNVILAEISGSTIAGGGILGMLAVVMADFLRRTKDTDDRRDVATKLVMDAALEREARAWTERDHALVERDAARAETQRVREQFDLERQRWQEARSWRQPPRPGPAPAPPNRGAP